MSRRSSPSPPGAEVLAADVLHPAAAEAAARGAQVIYQCANVPYQLWSRDLPVMQANLLAAAQAAGAKLVMADNLYMYGPPDGPMREDAPHNATDAKGRLRARLAAELLQAHAAGRVRVAIGRSSDYFGPGGLNSAAGEQFFGAAATGHRPRWLGSLDQPHSLSYLPDMAAGLASLGETEAGDGRAWHLPVQPALTGQEWTARLAEAVGRPLRAAVASEPLLLALGLFSPLLRELRGTLYQWQRPWVVDDAAFRETFAAAPTPVDEAIASTVAWFRERAASR